jgi:hypothetical protein
VSSDVAGEYFSQWGPKVTPLGMPLHVALLAQGCDSYVKTIYIGYEISGEMVAALYAHADHIELALAVAEDHPNMVLKDASHLTWRTLPLALEIRSTEDLVLADELIEEACARIRGGSHDVERDNDYFVRSRRDRKE